MALTSMTTALLALVVYKDRIRPVGWIFTITAFIGVTIIILWNSTLTIPMGALWTLLGYDIVWRFIISSIVALA